MEWYAGGVLGKEMKPITIVFEDDISVQHTGNGNYVVSQKCSLERLSYMIERAGGNPSEIIKKLLQDGKASCEIA